MPSGFSGGHRFGREYNTKPAGEYRGKLSRLFESSLLGVRRHDGAFPGLWAGSSCARRDASRLVKAATCRRTPKIPPFWGNPARGV